MEEEEWLARKPSWKRSYEAGLERKKGTEGREKSDMTEPGDGSGLRDISEARKCVVWTGGQEAAWFG